MNKFKRTIIKVAAVTTGVLLAGGIAAAYWSVSGGGEGNVTTADGIKPLTVTQTQTVNLFPGSEGQLGGLVSNPNTLPVTVNHVSTTLTVDALHSAKGCDVNNYIIQPIYFLNSNYPVTPGRVIPANTEVRWETYIGMKNTTENQDVCQGAVVTITYTVS